MKNIHSVSHLLLEKTPSSGYVAAHHRNNFQFPLSGGRGLTISGDRGSGMGSVSRMTFTLSFLFTTIFAFCQYKQIDIGGATLHYQEAGAGQPLVFIHGNAEDIRNWNRQLEDFSKSYRTIIYSRRFNYPNQKNPEVVNYSPMTEADDLASFVKKLELGSIHLIGHSYGAIIAMEFAKKYPELTKSLVISEPPMITWLPAIEGGQSEYDKFYHVLWRPVKIAFDLRDTADVLRHTSNYMTGFDDSEQIPAEFKKVLIENFAEWRALANSDQAFHNPSREELQQLKMPVMVITAGKTFKILDLTNPVLLKSMPTAEHFHLADATHDFWFTHADTVDNRVLNFLKNCK